MSSFDLDYALTYFLPRPAFGVAFAKRLPFVKLAVNWAGHDFTISLLNFTTFTFSSTMG
jgi:hypothetical protein